MTRLILILALACLSFTSAAFAEQQEAPTAPIKVIVNDQLELSFNDRVRLSQVLDAALVNWPESSPDIDIYWPNARLSMVAGPLSKQDSLEAKRLTVIEQLHGLADYWLAQGERERAAQAMALVEQLSSMILAWQPYGAPNLDASRLFLEENPLLAEGIYHLYLPEREPHFYVYGLTKSAGKQPIQPQQTLRGYLQPHHANELLWPDANTSHAYHISSGAPANAHASEQGWTNVTWGNYNASPVQMLPGDILLLGFEEPLLSLTPSQRAHARTLKQLNEDIAGLLRHWWADPGAQLMDSSIMRSVEQYVPSANNWQRHDLSPTRGNYGGIGLLQTPTARMAEEGEFVINYTDMDEYRRYSASLQVLPWLEATGFYVRFPNRLYSNSPGFSGNNILTDKGFDLKVRLLQERDYLPEISVGLNDFAGTGIFSGEYVVANKRWGAFDFSLGLGFGRLGTRDSFPNPFCEVKDSFCYRAGGTSGKGGKLETGNWFRGDAAIFGGVEYQTPVPGLRLKLEYEGNDYSQDNAGVDMTPKTPVNIGLTYRAYDWLDLQLGYERGDTFTFGFTIRTNLSTLSQMKVTPERVAATPAPEVRLQDIEWDSVATKLDKQYAFRSARFAVNEDESKVTAYVHPYRFRDGNEAIERAARVLAAELPESVATYEFVEQSLFIPMVATQVPAAEFRAQIANELIERKPAAVKEVFQRVEPGHRPDWDSPVWRDASEYNFKPGYALQPFFEQDFGAPETFHFYQLGLKGSVQLWLDDSTWFVTDVGINLSNNFDKFNFKVDAFDHLPLPRVRTYSREYMDNDFWLDTSQITRFQRFSDTVYGMAYAGLLERMFAGVGAEALWRPLDSPFSLGLDVNWVKQRDFNGGFGLRDYTTVTGFLTAYYQMPWLQDSMLQVGIGKFLAKDTGAAIQFQRRFDSGVIVGAYAHITNVSAEDYGEGSFTKGVFVSIPFDLLGVLPTRNRLGFDWVPLSRDGGQRLGRRVSLYGATDLRAPFYGR